MSNTLKLGNGQWATGKDTVLSFSDTNNNYKPLPFSFSRASSGTVVNKAGLIETVGSGEPRIDFKDNTKGALLLEPTRTNILLNSDNGSSYGLYSATKTLDEVISLDGTLNSFTLEGNGDTNQVLGYSSNKTLSAGDYTFSVFAKKGTNNFIQLFFDGFSGSLNGQAYFDLENGTTPSSFGRIENYGNGWYKCSVVGTVVGSDLTGRFGFRISYTSSNFFFPTANDAIGKNAYFYGFQAEAGSYATSYIPTSGQANGVTRVADVCNNGGNEQVINSTEGVLYAEISALANDLTSRYISINQNTSERVVIRYSTVNNQVQAFTTVAATTQANITHTLTNQTDLIKIAFKYKLNDFSLWINGVEVGTDTSGSVSAANSFDNLTFDQGNGAFPFYGNVKDIKLYNTTLTDQELIALTTI